MFSPLADQQLRKEVGDLREEMHKLRKYIENVDARVHRFTYEAGIPEFDGLGARKPTRLATESYVNLVHDLVNNLAEVLGWKRNPITKAAPARWIRDNKPVYDTTQGENK